MVLAELMFSIIHSVMENLTTLESNQGTSSNGNMKLRKRKELTHFILPQMETAKQSL